MEIQVERLCKAYHGKSVLREVSFTAGMGVTAVMAPSGAGKTTLLRILMGLERPDSGSVSPSGLRWSAVFQEDRLLEGQSAMGNLRFALGPALQVPKALELLEELGLDGAADQRVGEFSGGMKRRLALCRALLAPGDALALDEPFTGLDQKSRERCLALLRQEGTRRPLVLVTHDPSDALALDAAVVRL